MSIGAGVGPGLDREPSLGSVRDFDAQQGVANRVAAILGPGVGEDLSGGLDKPAILKSLPVRDPDQDGG
jgi:hypothetical protein